MKERFDPREPMELVMERLEPVFKDEAQRKLAETDPFLYEQGQRSAYAILKNGGARNAAELKKMKDAAANEKGSAK